MLRVLDTPAVVLGRHLDLLAWNPMAEALFGDPAGYPPERLNMLLLMFDETATASRTCEASRGWWFHLVTGRLMPRASLSWKAWVPITPVATWPLMHSTGIESLMASSRPVMVLLTPGPEVTSTTPRRPVLRA